ncbi:HAD family hydrolase [Halobacteriaceae archaeon GCM10025711]
MYDAVIFDNDGVLTTPTPAAVNRASVRLAFQDHGVPSPTEADVTAMFRDAAAVDAVCEAYGIDTEAFWATRERRAADGQAVELGAGTKRLYEDVAALRGLDADLGIVSNNQHRTIEYIVDRFDLDDLFATYYGRDPTLDGFRSRKPDPHYLERAVADLDADSVLYVGDTDCDVGAADRLGVDSVFLRRSHRTGYRLSDPPTFEVSSLTALVDLVNGSGDVGDSRAST